MYHFFPTNFESVIYWYFLLQYFESVKELHKVWFPILNNTTNLHFLFVGQQVRKNTCQCLSEVKFKLHLSTIFPKNTFDLSSPYQKFITRIGGGLRKLSIFLLFLVNPNKSVHTIALQKYKLFFEVDWLYV